MGDSAGTAAAKKEPKSYPEEGKIVGIGTTEHTHVSGSILGASGSATIGNVGSRSKYTYTYKVQTGTKILQLGCGQEAVFHSTGKEYGGAKPLKVGDVIHFRIEKELLYILVTAKVSVDEYDPSKGDREAQVEQTLRIMSEDEASKSTPPTPAPQVQQSAELNTTKLFISSTPAGADIEVDGGFVGNTPSTIEVTPGDHTIIVSKSGYKSWERKLKTSGGNVNLNAELGVLEK